MLNRVKAVFIQQAGELLPAIHARLIHVRQETVEKNLHLAGQLGLQPAGCPELLQLRPARLGQKHRIGTDQCGSRERIVAGGHQSLRAAEQFPP